MRSEKGIQVVSIGVANHDVIAAVRDPVLPDGRILASEIVEGGGGNAATAAVTLARLGVRTAFVGRVGEDPTGDSIRLRLEREGVDTSGVQRIAGGRSPSSVVLVNLETAERSIIACPAVGAAVVLTDAELRMCAAAEWIHVDQVGYAAVAQIREAGIKVPVSLDAGNPIPGLTLSGIDLFAPTRSALLRIMGTDEVEEAIRLALDAGPSMVAVTCGSDGSFAVTRTERAHHPGFNIPGIVSTLGAGDVFHGALLAAIIRGLSLGAALRYANAAAALSCRALDARSAIPSEAELGDFLAATAG